MATYFVNVIFALEFEAPDKDTLEEVLEDMTYTFQPEEAEGVVFVDENLIDWEITEKTNER